MTLRRRYASAPRRLNLLPRIMHVVRKHGKRLLVLLPRLAQTAHPLAHSRTSATEPWQTGNAHEGETRTKQRGSAPPGDRRRSDAAPRTHRGSEEVLRSQLRHPRHIRRTHTVPGRMRGMACRRRRGHGASARRRQTPRGPRTSRKMKHAAIAADTNLLRHPTPRRYLTVFEALRNRPRGRAPGRRRRTPQAPSDSPDKARDTEMQGHFTLRFQAGLGRVGPCPASVKWPCTEMRYHTATRTAVRDTGLNL